MAKTIFAALFGWTTLIVGGCAERNDPLPTTPEARITAALQEVLRRNDAPFAIIEHPPTKKFVQFTGSARDTLMLDLAAQALTPEERARAEQLFVSLGGTQTEVGFQLDTGRDAEEAARITLRVFREVYQLPDDAELTAEVDS